jgi:hypothetical protein
MVMRDGVRGREPLFGCRGHPKALQGEDVRGKVFSVLKA